MLQSIFELVEKILVWADASAEAQQIVKEVFEWLMGVIGWLKLASDFVNSKNTHNTQHENRSLIGVTAVFSL